MVPGRDYERSDQAMTSVALCITDLNVGGAERCLFELATRLDRNRFEPVVYCLSPAPPAGETTLIPALQSAGLEFECLGARKLSDFPKVVARLANMLRQRKTQVIQTFLSHANFVGRIAAWRAGVPSVVCGIRVAQRHSSWHLWLDRMTHRLVDRYVCVSQAVAAFSAGTARLPAEKLVVIPNGIDLSRFHDVRPADLSGLGIAGRRLVTFIGRLEAQKGLPDLLATASNWLRRLPDCDLLLVGKGPLAAALQRQCREAGIDQRVHFAGWRADIPAILAASSLLVLTSAWEGMPNVVLEAMASGLPVVATQVEGVCEALGPGFQEQSVPYGKWEEFSDSLVRILSDCKLADRLGRANRRRTEHQFTIERMVASYQGLWERIVAGSR
jgi:glycosyltransferase involved in cell wall biosynthesis